MLKVGRPWRRPCVVLIILIMLSAIYSSVGHAQQSEYRGRIGHMGCRPVKERTREMGCWIMANVPVGQLGAAPIYWHLDLYPSRNAAEAAKVSSSAVVEALGRVWLFTIEHEQWRASGSEHVADIGPLPVSPKAQYTARYMEAIFEPGMTSSVHRHSGPEAWYTLSGETCLETSEGKMIGRPGGPPVIVPPGLPMYLTATGSGMRRALVLILYDSSKPAATPANDWAPKGLCNKS